MAEPGENETSLIDVHIFRYAWSLISLDNNKEIGVKIGIYLVSIVIGTDI